MTYFIAIVISVGKYILLVSVCVTMSYQDWIHVRTLQALCVSVIIVDRKYCLLNKNFWQIDLTVIINTHSHAAPVHAGGSQASQQRRQGEGLIQGHLL